MQETNAPIVSSRSYSGHENDQDANNFVQAYPAKVGSRLDDCQLCHRAGVTGTSTASIGNSCSYCHLLQWPDSTRTTGVPANYQDTLNQFGLDYKNAGRSVAAFSTIASTDSDGDSSTNDVEIADDRFPGDANSKPGQTFAPTRTFTMSQIAALTQHPEFLLLNTNKQQFDDYATYNGPTVNDILTAAGVNTADANITGISVFAPDGFKQDFLIANITAAYPNSTFYYVDQSAMAMGAQFVNYPTSIPTNPATSQPFANNDAITDLWLTIAYQRDGAALSTSYIDKTSGKMNGEGPFRIIPPQTTPGRPDRGSAWNLTTDDGWNYGSTLDHNAGKSVRGVCIIRVNSASWTGYEEYDTSNGWSLINDQKIVVYGYGIN